MSPCKVIVSCSWALTVMSPCILQDKLALQAQVRVHCYVALARRALAHWQAAVAHHQHKHMQEAQAVIHYSSATAHRALQCWKAGAVYRQFKRTAVQQWSRHAVRRGFDLWRSHARERHIRTFNTNMVSMLARQQDSCNHYGLQNSARRRTCALAPPWSWMTLHLWPAEQWHALLLWADIWQQCMSA